jgi:hypothetical protein
MVFSFKAAIGLAAAFGLLACASTATNAQANAEASHDLIEPLQPLRFLIEVGNWRAEPTFYAADGSVRERGRSVGYAKPILNGHAIEQGGSLFEPFEISIVSWIIPGEK